MKTTIDYCGSSCGHKKKRNWKMLVIAFFPWSSLVVMPLLKFADPVVHFLFGGCIGH